MSAGTICEAIPARPGVSRSGRVIFWCAWFAFAIWGLWLGFSHGPVEGVVTQGFLVSFTLFFRKALPLSAAAAVRRSHCERTRLATAAR
jgi:hypothetical protein